MSKLAINGGTKVRNKPWTKWPIFDNAERKGLNEVLESGKWWYGAKVKQFEAEYANFHDAKYAVSCTNGTAALEIALIALGIGAGDEVIIPPYTFVATATAVLKVNAIPVFVDVNEDTWCLDEKLIEKAITKKTKAIAPVHFGGLPADMDKINKLAKKYNLKVLEDACHSWGSKWKGKGTGALGDMGAFSFQASKNINSGEGGIILSDNKDYADLARSYSNCGRLLDKPWYAHYILGGNYRLTEFQAAILLAQLSRLGKHTSTREANAAYLNEKLGDLPGIKLTKRDKRVTRRSYHLYNFRYVEKELGGVPREKFIAAMAAEGLGISGGYPHPLYKNPLFLTKGTGAKHCPISCPYYGKKVDYSKVKCDVTERICYKEGAWFGHTVLLGNKQDMKDVVTIFEKVIGNINELK
ncbi:MAG: DegT/DnrJ/EryC1/StrS family aminotransferase [Elusimicrobiota bacterium]